MKTRLWNRNKDYPTLASWWEQYSWEAVASEILPNNAYIVSNDAGQDVAAGFVYFTNNAPIAYADWFITNPKSSNKDKHYALNLVYKKIEEECRKKKCKVITATITSKTLVKRMIRDHGYEVASHKVMQLMRVLDNEDMGDIDYFRDQESIDQNSPKDDRKSYNLNNLPPDKKEILSKAERDEY